MIYMMRHGKTDWNAEHRMQGRTDIPINEEGRAMAIAAGEKYQDVHFDVCYCSPLSRARETAELFLRGRGVPVIPDDRLVEMCFGIYEGTTGSFKIPDCPINKLFQEPQNYIPGEGGETMEALLERTGDFLRETAIPLSEAGKNVLIVGHGVMNCSLYCNINHLSAEHFWDCSIENCVLHRIL